MSLYSNIYNDLLTHMKYRVLENVHRFAKVSFHVYMILPFIENIKPSTV